MQERPDSKSLAAHQRLRGLREEFVAMVPCMDYFPRLVHLERIERLKASHKEIVQGEQLTDAEVDRLTAILVREFNMTESLARELIEKLLSLGPRK